MKIEVIVPFHPREPLHIVKGSYRSLTKLNFDGKLSITYVTDSDEREKKVRWLKGKAKILARDSTKGGKAGAINYALRNLDKEPDFIAFFDIDSRPDPDFIQECLKALKSERYQRNAFMASGLRYVTNKNENFVTKLASVQYELMSDLQRVTNYFGLFTGFNGLIGLLCSADIKLNESAICEDTDFLLRMHMQGKRAILTLKKKDGSRTKVGEQVPTTIRNFIDQQTRWMKGGFEAIRWLRKKGSFMLVLSIISILFPLIWLPLIPTYYVELAKKHGSLMAFKNLGACFLIPFILFFCSILALWKLLAGKEIMWKSSKRSKL